MDDARIDKIIFAAGLAGAVLIGAGALWSFLNNPTNGRATALESELASIEATPITFKTRYNVNYGNLNQVLASRATMFREIVPPPPPPPKAVPGPNMNKQAEGIFASARMKMQRDGVLYIHIKSKDNPRGDYYRVGDVVQGLTIKKITDNEVIFSLEYNAKEYTKAVPRR